MTQSVAVPGHGFPPCHARCPGVRRSLRRAHCWEPHEVDRTVCARRHEGCVALKHRVPARPAPPAARRTPPSHLHAAPGARRVPGVTQRTTCAAVTDTSPRARASSGRTRHHHRAQPHHTSSVTGATQADNHARRLQRHTHHRRAVRQPVQALGCLSTARTLSHEAIRTPRCPHKGARRGSQARARSTATSPHMSAMEYHGDRLIPVLNAGTAPQSDAHASTAPCWR